MRDILKTEELEIPDGVTVSVKSRVIVVTGPRGTLTKTVRHVNMDIRLIKTKTKTKINKVTLAVWQGNRKHVACLRTIRSLISNMITGVTKVWAIIRVWRCNGLMDRVGLSIQNACGLRPLPHQLHYSGRWS
jgi:ribosomal protein L6P/L9E